MRRGPVVWLLGLLGVLLLAEVALVATVLTSENGNDSVYNAAVSTREFLFGTRGSPGAFERAGDVGSNVVRVLTGGSRQAERGDTKFAGCISCHPDYGTDRKFSATYIDHSKHTEMGLSCAKCHIDTAHPNPVLPSEKVCATCHKEVKKKGKCDLCHPPGSLPHFYQAGFPREGPVACNTCHKQGAFSEANVPLPVVDPSNKPMCLTCHEQKKCDSCHGLHPANWVSIHGQSVFHDGATACSGCHNVTTCATACHNDRSIMNQLR